MLKKVQISGKTMVAQPELGLLILGAENPAPAKQKEIAKKQEKRMKLLVALAMGRKGAKQVFLQTIIHSQTPSFLPVLCFSPPPPCFEIYFSTRLTKTSPGPRL